MSQNSDSGHSKNVSNFEDLISFCSGQGANYNPSKESLTLTKLQALHTLAQEGVQQSNITRTAFDRATNARAIAFKDFKPFATKLINALAASGASDLAIADARTLVRKIAGIRAPKADTTATANTNDTIAATTNKTISASQLSYDNQMEHFFRLIEVLSQDADYKPNEADMKIPALQAKLATMKSTNTDVINAYTTWSNARFVRDNNLYNPITGLVQTAIAVKKYIKSVNGASSPVFKHISGLEFKTRELA